MRRNKMLMVLFAAAFTALSAGNVFALTVEEEIAALKSAIAEMQKEKGPADLAGALGITAEAGGTFILQGVNKANGGSGSGRIDGSFTLDLGFGAEFKNGGMAYMLVEGGSGEGLNGTSEDPLNPGTFIPFIRAYSSLNGDAGTSESLLEVTELWYEQPLFDNKLTVTFGKLNPTVYFDENAAANDETEQFLASMFVNNAAVLFPDNSLGLRMTYSPAEFLDITYAYFNQNTQLASIDTGGFNAVQTAFKYAGNGNYRLMYWSSNVDANGESVYGFGLSLDQALSETVSLFARYGYKNPEIADDDNPIANSWSFGAQVSGIILNRENDAAGFAFGQNMASKDWLKSNNLKEDSETQAEIYYKLSVNKHIALTPVLQYVLKPMGANAANDNDLFTFGIRTQINF